MKAKERQHLKQNEFATTAGRVIDTVRLHQRQALTVVAAVVLVIAAFGGFLVWRNVQENRAGTLLGMAMATSQASIAPPSSLPGAAQAPGTFPTEKARSEAALEAYQELVAEYPSSDAALTARYEAAGELLDLGRIPEAEALFNEVIAAGSDVYSPMARLGLAQAKLMAGSYDDAVKLYTELSGDRDGALPVDGVLMQLGEAYRQAGKPDEARAAYRRIVDEFAESVYVAEAREQLAALN